MMSLSNMNVQPATGPGLAEMRTASAARERATLAFQAQYSTAVALRRRQSAMKALDQMLASADAWMENTTAPAIGWLPDPNPDSERIN